MPNPTPLPPGPSLDALTHAIVSMNAHHTLDAVLQEMLTACASLTDSKYAAINVLNSKGRSIDFHYIGMDPGIWEAIGRAPNKVGVLREIPAEGTLVIDDLNDHPAFGGLPPEHPPLGAFMGAALKVRGEVFGYLYLAGKPGGFVEEDNAIVEALAAAASVAIDNAVLYRDANSRQDWLEASQSITTAILRDPEDEEIFTTILTTAQHLARADHAVLALPGVDGHWVMEVTAGPVADDLLGLELPPDGFGMSSITSGKGAIAAIPRGTYVLDVVKDFGPLLYAPLRSHDTTVGLLMLWRQQGGPEFSKSDLTVAQRFANHAAVALSLAEVSHVKNVSALHEQRERLADDLHDFVSQELFATAIQLESIASEVDAATAARLRGTLEHVKRAQFEVRGVMSSLAGHRSSEPLSERLSREVVLAAETLGFAPITNADWDAVAQAVADDRSLADDSVAVVRELLSNVARHARATAVTVDVNVGDGRLTVELIDNGIGPKGSQQRHSGTSNLANRAIRRSGTFALVENRPGAEQPGSRATWDVAITP